MENETEFEGLWKDVLHFERSDTLTLVVTPPTDILYQPMEFTVTPDLTIDAYVPEKEKKKRTKFVVSDEIELSVSGLEVTLLAYLFALQRKC